MDLLNVEEEEKQQQQQVQKRYIYMCNNEHQSVANESPVKGFTLKVHSVPVVQFTSENVGQMLAESESRSHFFNQVFKIEYVVVFIGFCLHIWICRFFFFNLFI